MVAVGVAIGLAIILFDKLVVGSQLTVFIKPELNATLMVTGELRQTVVSLLFAKVWGGFF